MWCKGNLHILWSFLNWPTIGFADMLNCSNTSIVLIIVYIHTNIRWNNQFLVALNPFVMLLFLPLTTKGHILNNVHIALVYSVAYNNSECAQHDLIGWTSSSQFELHKNFDRKQNFNTKTKSYLTVYINKSSHDLLPCVSEQSSWHTHAAFRRNISQKQIY